MVQSSRNTAIYRAPQVDYKKDAMSNTACQQEIKVSVDLRKVIMLTKIDVIMTCVFTNHLVTFNETFSEFGKNGKDTAVVWHEAWFGWLVDCLTSSSTTTLYRGRVPRLTTNNFTCGYTRDRAGRP